MAQELKRSKTRVMEGSSMAVGGDRRSRVRGNTHLALATFQKGGWVRAPKVVTLSVLKMLVELFNLTQGPNTLARGGEGSGRILESTLSA